MQPHKQCVIWMAELFVALIQLKHEGGQLLCIFLNWINSLPTLAAGLQYVVSNMQRICLDQRVKAICYLFTTST